MNLSNREKDLYQAMRLVEKDKDFRKYIGLEEVVISPVRWIDTDKRQISKNYCIEKFGLHIKREGFYGIGCISRFNPESQSWKEYANNRVLCKDSLGYSYNINRCRSEYVGDLLPELTAEVLLRKVHSAIMVRRKKNKKDLNVLMMMKQELEMMSRLGNSLAAKYRR